MADSDNYEALARSARDQAAAATLANVRERCLRSEAAWIAMAERSRRTEKARAARAAMPVPVLDG
ncbi:hypothetical protein [Sphingomonas lenta]|uniref:Uncharacterized protein n=1 Tax=Sphingomonas lenta TaxID=1141887 RepID=A0A2A2SJ75_9SPHN|nr:hypothetical protein [Sphingomonas lenta]PAX09275.1 hypothetical protein CKY28_00480 [Sphingomonas lenta]